MTRPIDRSHFLTVCVTGLLCAAATARRSGSPLALAAHAAAPGAYAPVPPGAYAPVPLCALDAAGCRCESACICERLSIRADFVKLANRVIEHTSIRRVRVWLLPFVFGGLFFFCSRDAMGLGKNKRHFIGLSMSQTPTQQSW